MRRWGVVACCLLILLAAWGLPASAENSLVQDVRVVNTGTVPADEEFVRSHIQTVPGRNMDAAQISRDVKALLSTERFTTVNAAMEPGTNGVVVVFAVNPRVRLSDAVEVTGNRRLSGRKIRALVELQPGDVVDDNVLAVRTRKVVDEYRYRKRCPDAAVRWEIKPVAGGDPGVVTVKLTVSEGNRYRFGKVAFEGNTSLPESDIRKAFRIRPWWNPVGWFSRPRFDAAELSAGRQIIRDMYLQKGCLDAEVGMPEVRWETNGTLTVATRVSEGISYRLGKVTVEGNTLFPASELAPLAVTKSGEVAADGTIRNISRAIRDFYGSRGYVNTVVRPARDSSTNGMLDVRFQVTEGNLVNLRNVVIRGNARTRDKVIRREILVYPGEIYNEVKIGTSERRLMNLGYFDQVRSYPESTRLPDTRDLVFEVEEKRTGQFMVGAGFSSIDKMMGFMEISQGNFDIKGWPYFTGGGQKLKLRAQVGSRREDYELSFVEPWFLDRKLSLGVDLYHSRVSYDEYDVRRRGTALTLGKGLPWANRLTLTYRLEEVTLSDIVDTNTYFFVEDPSREFRFNQDKERVNSSLTLALTHDTRDNPFVPTRGNRMSVFSQASGGLLGFDTEIYGLGAQGAWYFPLWLRHVFSLRAKYETVDSYGDLDQVPVDERLFMGGGRTLRGFDYRNVGPKVARTVTSEDGTQYETTHPVGGQSMAMVNAEYWIPVVTGIRLAGFVDVGNAWLEPYEFNSGDTASSAGVGIRFDIPGFPIRIDRGWILRKDDQYTGADEIVFWVGYDF